MPASPNGLGRLDERAVKPEGVRPLASAGRDELRPMLEAVGVPAFVAERLTDGAFRISAANSRLEAAAARPPRGLELCEAFGEPAGFAIESVLQRCVDAGQPIECTRRVPIDGQDRCWHMAVTPIADRAARVTRLVTTIFDLTEHRRQSDALHHALESASDGIAAWGADGRLILSNERFRACYPEIGDRLQPGLHRAEFAKAVRCHEEQTPSDAGGRTREEHLSDGRRVLAVDQLSTSGCVVSIRTDVTETFHLRRAALTARSAARASLDSADALIAQVNGDGIVLSINRLGADWLGCESRDLVGCRIGSVFEGHAGARFEALVDGVARTGERQSAHLDWCDRVLAADVSPDTGTDGRTHAVALRVRDVTEQQASEEAELRRQRLLFRLQRIASLDQPVATLAHEVGQPLSAVVSFCQGVAHRLASGTFDVGEVTAALNAACQEAERVDAIVRRVAGFMCSTDEARLPVDISTAVRDAVDLAESELRRAGIETVALLADNPPPVVADPIEIGQVVHNLLRNAAAALTNANVQAPRITVATAVGEGGDLLVTVEDNGPGFPSGASDKVFEPFFTTKPESLGMGLSICREIVGRHGGSITAGAGETGGARITFSLPFEEACLAS